MMFVVYAVFGGVQWVLSLDSLFSTPTHINCLSFFCVIRRLRSLCVSCMRFSSLIFTRFAIHIWCRKKVEIAECWRLDFHRMDSPLFTVLGDGSGALLSPLLSRCHIQFDANRWVELIFQYVEFHSLLWSEYLFVELCVESFIWFYFSLSVRQFCCKLSSAWFASILVLSRIV